MNRRSLVVGGVLVAAVALFYVLSQSQDNTPQIQEDTPISTTDTESKIEEVLGRTIPDDVEKATLRDLTDLGMSAIATRVEDGGVVEFSVLADLAESSEPYEVWAGASGDNLRKLGVMAAAKGGYLFEYRQAGALDNYNSVEIKQGDTRVLEGSF